MQTSNRLFDDLARVASGAFNTLSGLREEIETRVRERVERMAADLDLVTREEFDAVRAMAAKARAGQEAAGGAAGRARGRARRGQGVAARGQARRRPSRAPAARPAKLSRPERLRLTPVL